MSPAFPRYNCSLPFHGLCEANNSSGHCPASEVTAWDKQGEVVLMLKKVRHLDVLLYPLDQERARLMREINILQAATRNIPPEVLSIIFQFARPPIKFTPRPIPPASSNIPDLGRRRNPEDNFQLVLGAVSSYWRQVAWSTPQLWTTFSIEVRKARCTDSISLLNLYFENSRNLPMAIELDLMAQMWSLKSADGAKKRDEFISFLEPVKNSVFVDNAERIQNLILTGFPIEWVPSIGENLSRCESITLHWPGPFGNHQWDSTYDPMNLAGLPRLHHVHLERLPSSQILPGSNITILRLHRMLTEHCVKLLTGCQNLITLETFAPLSSSDSFPLFNRPIVLEHLESLTWWHISDGWCRNFLSNARFKKLRILQLSGFVGDPSDTQIWTSFTSRLPATLQILRFANTSSGRPTRTLFVGIPQVHTIHLAELSQEFILETFRVLSRRISFPGTMLLPNLRTVIVDRYVADLSQGDIANMLKELYRDRTTGEFFRLELRSGFQAVPFKRRFLADLGKLAMKGFEWEIISGGLVVHMLSSIGCREAMQIQETGSLSRVVKFLSSWTSSHER